MAILPPWTLRPNAPLDRLNTFGLRVIAPWLLDLNDVCYTATALADGRSKGLPFLPLGSGSNVLFVGDPRACIVRVHPCDITILADQRDHVIVRVGGGLDWHRCVMWSLQQGFFGLENLALIPGTVGACAVQNIGAYGVQIAALIACVETFDCQSAAFRNLSAQECQFGYRDSLFKRQADRYLIVAVQFRLARRQKLTLDYPGIGEELRRHGVTHASARDVADAIIRIRSRKLPDPKIVGNAGSFFKNPLISRSAYDALHHRLPHLPSYPVADQTLVKIPAAGLIEACGWKGRRINDAGISDQHALVLVNHGRATGSELLQLAQTIRADVFSRYGVDLEPEPRLIGATWHTMAQN